MLVQLSSYLQSIEAEKQKIKSQVKRLCQENAWLRDELAAAQKKLQESEQYSAQIEVELTHLKFLKELKKFDEDLNAPQMQLKQEIPNELRNAEESTGDNTKKLDLAFPEEDEEHQNNNC